MKILKKIGIGCLALIICFCSCFKFVNAYDYNTFDYSSTQSGTNYHQPFINAELFLKKTYQSSTYYSLPLSQSVYIDLTDTRNDYSTIYNSELEVRSQIGIFKQNPSNLSVYRPIAVPNSDNVEIEHYNYTSYRCEFIYYTPFTPSEPEQFIISLDYGLFQNRDTSWNFDIIDNSSSNSLNIIYEIKYLLNDTTEQTYNKTLSIAKANGMFIFGSYSIEDTNNEDWQYLNQSQILSYNVYIDTSNLDITQFNYGSQIINTNDYNNIVKLIYKSNNSFLNNSDNVDVDTDFTSWLVNSVGAFMNAELFPGFQLSTLLGVIVSIPILIYILRLFMGG